MGFVGFAEGSFKEEIPWAASIGDDNITALELHLRNTVTDLLLSIYSSFFSSQLVFLFTKTNLSYITIISL